MKKVSAKAVLYYRTAGFIISTAGIVLHMMTDDLLKTGFMIRHKLAYFTIQTNIFIALMFGLLLFKTLLSRCRNKCWSVEYINPGLHAGLTLYISMTMLGFWLILAPTTGLPRNPFLFFSSFILHTLTPLLAIFDFILFSRHGLLKKKSAALWLIYPSVYLLFVMLYSRFITEPYYSFELGGRFIDLMYPYPFLDAAVIGYVGVAAAVLVLAAVFYFMGRLFICLDKKTAAVQNN